jgi:hypothetical protein
MPAKRPSKSPLHLALETVSQNAKRSVGVMLSAAKHLVFWQLAKTRFLAEFILSPSKGLGMTANRTR